MKTLKPLLFLFSFVLLAGCLGPLKPGNSSFAAGGISGQMRQSENPQQESTQVYRRSEEQGKVTEEVATTVGAAQKDMARELTAKLSSLKGVVWVGVLVFLFGAASAVYPPLKVVVGSTTTSAVLAAAGLAMIVLPSLLVGHELLIMSVAAGVAAIWFFSHRHGELRGALKTITGSDTTK